MITVEELYELEAQRKCDEELEKIKQYLLENYSITEKQASDLVIHIQYEGHAYCNFVDVMYDVTDVLDIVCKKKESY